MDVPIGVWIAAGVITVFLIWATIFATNKAYSKKWEDSDE